MNIVRVDVWSDVACPWCWVGKRHLEEATGMFTGEVRLVWHAFQLDPRAPRTIAGPVDYVGRLSTKYGIEKSRAESMIDRMREVGRTCGLEFHFERVKPVNTFDAHRLIALGKHHGRQTATKERLLRAYFQEGRVISDRDELQALALEVGIPEPRVREVLQGDDYADEVRADLARAAELGASGVPFFLLDGRLGISGAQPATVLVDALEQALASADPAADAEVEGEVCSPEGCG